MVIPNAETIEDAVEHIKSNMDPKILEDQLKELKIAVGDKSSDFYEGFNLGIQTARLHIDESSVLLLKGVNPEEVL